MSVRFCFLLCAVLLSPPLCAASLSSPASQELIRQRQQQLLEQQQQRLQDLQNLPSAPAPSAPAAVTAGQCFDIQHIHLNGVTLLSATDQQALLKPFLNQCLGVTQLNALLKAITEQYIELGYVTSRAYLPPQDLGDGTLEVQVVEGRLETLEGAGLASPRELALSFPGESGEVLDLRELEQMLEQINRLPSRQVELELLPGQQVGSSHVQLKGQRDKPWRASLNRNNDGQVSTGEQQWGVGLDWDSPLGLADQLSLRGSGDTVSDSQRQSDSQSLFYSLPYGWWTFSYNYSESSYRSQTQAAGFDFQQKGDTQVNQLSAERILLRDSVSKTAVSLGTSHTRSNNYLEDTLIDVASQRLSEAQLGFNHGRRIGTAFVNLDIGWQRGIGAFDAQGAGEPHGGQPVARYNKYTATFSLLQPFWLWGEALSFESLATGQQSEDVLYSLQRFSVGGLSSVRGFKEQSLTGDSGGYWRNQVQWRKPVSWAPLQTLVQEYGVALAYDQGVIEHGRYNPEQHGRLSGNAIALSARGEHLNASVTFSRSLERPAAIAQQEHPLYFRVELLF